MPDYRLFSVLSLPWILSVLSFVVQLQENFQGFFYHFFSFIFFS